MKPIQIVTDSTAYISKDYIEKNNIEIVPLSVEFCGETQKEGFPGEFDEYFDTLAKSNEFPKTSQPSVGDFVEAFNRAFQEGDEVVAILLSSKLSGTYNSATIASELVNPEKITVIDSETAVANLKMLIEKAVDLSQSGASRKEIIDMVNKDKKQTSINLTVDSLEYLKRGGRLSNSKALIGSILNIKPIIGLVDGKLIPVDKAKGKRRAMEKMIDMIPSDSKRITICHVQNFDEANKIKVLISEKFGNALIDIDELGPVIGSHIGPKGIGICSSW